MTQELGLDRFEVLEELVSSPIEILLRARDRVLDREILLKLPGPGVAPLLRKRTVREQTLREARALARVRHRGVVRLHDVLETPQGPLLVLEPVVGERLADRIEREKRLDPTEAVELGHAIADALAAVHAEGIVHRGLSAAAIVVADDGHPIITGFEFAKLTGSGASMSGTSLWYQPGPRTPRPDASPQRVSPPGHAAPEQLRGERADARCDVFALGWVLFEALAGCPPYETSDPHDWRAPRDLRALVPDVSRELSRVIAKCLAPGPLKRFDNAASLRAAFEALRSGKRPARRVRTRVLLSLAALVVVALGLLSGPRLWGAMSRDVRGSGAPDDVGSAPRPLRAEGESYAPGYRKRFALLIGIGDVYEESGYPRLPNAEGDVGAIAQRLRALPGAWEVTTLEGRRADRNGILHEVRSLSRRAEAEDSIFIYYAGHGLTDEVADDSAWIIPAGAGPDDVAGRIRFEEFTRVFAETYAKHVLVAMDCCYSGRLAVATRAVAPQSSLRRRYDDKFTRRKAHVVLASGRANEVVSDGELGHLSPFARAFLEVLGRDVDAVTDFDIAAHIRNAMLVSEVSQQPVMKVVDEEGLGGAFVFYLR